MSSCAVWRKGTVCSHESRSKLWIVKKNLYSIRLLLLVISIYIYILSSSSIFYSFFPLSSGFGSDFKMITFFIITMVVNVVTIVLCVVYWHVDQQRQIVRIGNCLKS